MPSPTRCGRRNSRTARRDPHGRCAIARHDQFRRADAGENRARVDRAKLDALEAALAPDEPINIQFTSGTTGNPKGATPTHRNIVNNARYIAMAMRLSEQDLLCIPVPLYQCFSMVLACVSTGCAMVFPGEAFDPAATLAAVHDERCTACRRCSSPSWITPTSRNTTSAG